MTRKRLSLNQINLIWSINQPRYIIPYKVTHVVYSISNIWWRWILIKKKKKKARKHLFLKQRSCCEFEIDPSGKQRKNVIVTFSFREKISEQTYDSRVPNILAIIHIFENHCYVRIKEIQFPSIFVENITFGEKKSLLKLLIRNIRDFENISRSQLRKIDLIRMHKYIQRIKVSRVLFFLYFLSFFSPECKLPSQIRLGIDAKYPFETLTCTIWFPKTRSRGGGPRREVR